MMKSSITPPQYKTILHKDNVPYYVTRYEFARFVVDNFDKGLKAIDNAIERHNIIPKDEEYKYWSREFVFDGLASKQYDPEAIVWLKAFFDAHHFINRMVICNS